MNPGSSIETFSSSHCCQDKIDRSLRLFINSLGWSSSWVFIIPLLWCIFQAPRNYNTLNESAMDLNFGLLHILFVPFGLECFLSFLLIHLAGFPSSIKFLFSSYFTSLGGQLWFIKVRLGYRCSSSAFPQPFQGTLCCNSLLIYLSLPLNCELQEIGTVLVLVSSTISGPINTCWMKKKKKTKWSVKACIILLGEKIPDLQFIPTFFFCT